MSDDELLAAFESCQVPPDGWTHLAHVRVGYLYVAQFGYTAALVRMRSGLYALNTAHKVPLSLDRGYHETVTIAYLRLISAALGRHGPFASSTAFCEACPELLDKSVLRQFYSPDRLKTWDAKARFIEPDLAPFAQLSMALLIRPETPADHEAIAEINRQAFGQVEEAKLVAALRDGGYVSLSLVAELDRQIVGHLLFGPLTIATAQGDMSALSLAPLAVLPGQQRQGIGKSLVQNGLARCRNAGHTIVIVVGHPDYYPRFGFSAKLAENLKSPFSGDPAWMALELTPGALHGVAGTVKYPPPFGIVS